MNNPELNSVEEKQDFTGIHDTRTIVMIGKRNTGMHLAVPNNIVTASIHGNLSNSIEEKRLRTPIIKAWKENSINEEKQLFYSESEFTEWIRTNGHDNQPPTGWKIKYYMGLATSSEIEESSIPLYFEFQPLPILNRLSNLNRSPVLNRSPEYNSFSNNDSVEIDPITCDLETLLELYNVNPNSNPRFKFKNQMNNGYGTGADIYCKTILLKRILDYYFETLDIWYIVPKFSLFTNEDSLIKVESLSRFIKSCINAKVLMPKHLHPKFIMAILEMQLTLEQLMYYLSYIDPDMYDRMIKLDDSYKINPLKFKELGTGYETFECMILNKVIGQPFNTWEKIVAMTFEFKDYDNDPIELDKVISESYILTHELVINIFNIIVETCSVNEEKQKMEETRCVNLWHEFIAELSQDELRTMLTLFTGFATITSVIYLHIESIKCDLNMRVCSRNVTVNKTLFETKEALNRLKIYFLNSNDSIDDSNGYSRRLTMEKRKAPTDSSSNNNQDSLDKSVIQQNPSVSMAERLAIDLSFVHPNHPRQNSVPSYPINETHQVTSRTMPRIVHPSTIYDNPEVLARDVCPNCNYPSEYCNGHRLPTPSFNSEFDGTDSNGMPVDPNMFNRNVHPGESNSRYLKRHFNYAVELKINTESIKSIYNRQKQRNSNRSSRQEHVILPKNERFKLESLMFGNVGAKLRSKRNSKKIG
jgi:hypothetical protein